MALHKHLAPLNMPLLCVLLTYFLCWGSSCRAGCGGCSALRSVGDQERGANARQLNYIPR